MSYFIASLICAAIAAALGVWGNYWFPIAQRRNDGSENLVLIVGAFGGGIFLILALMCIFVAFTL
jgi:hypothetical protein